MERSSLIDLLDDDGDDVVPEPSLSKVTAKALQDAKVREMLQVFRTQGPAALGQYVNDPSYSASLEILRDQAGRMPTEHLQAPPEVVAQGRILAPSSAPMMPIASATLITEDTYSRVAPVVAQQLEQSATVRDMLDAFRREGPKALARYAHDPECNALVDQLRGAQPTLEAPPRAPVESDPFASQRDIELPEHGFAEQRTATWPHQRRPRVLVACTGSVAAVKAPQLCVAISEFADVQLVLTDNAAFFLDRAADYDAAAKEAFDAANFKVWRNTDEWTWQKVGDDVVHIELRKWADVLLVAPLGANGLAKLANGICDDLVTCVARAWDVRLKPIIVAPAMNTAMWHHPATAVQLRSLQTWGVSIVHPATKTLACGDTGIGALAGVDDIVSKLRADLGLPLKLTPL